VSPTSSSSARPNRLSLIVGFALAAGALLPAPGVDAASPSPPSQQLDSVVATGTGSYGAIRADVESGPSGESPSGQVAVGGTVEIHGQVLPAVLYGPATCLNVNGNTAVVKFDATLEVAGATFAFGSVAVTLQDNGGSGLDMFGLNTGYDPDPTTCSSPGGMAPLDGRAVIFDAQPLPTSKDECRSGAFAGFGFKNLGQCISYVNARSGTG
jgi:hypothetical protein